MRYIDDVITPHSFRAEQCSVEDGLIVSKDALRQWKSKAFTCSEAVPFNASARCHHGNLSMDARYLQVIPAEAWAIIEEFAGRTAVVRFEEACNPCSLCKEELEKETEENATSKIQAAEEKAALPKLYKKGSTRPAVTDFADRDHAESGHTLYVVPSSFVLDWKAWCRSTSLNERPVLNFQRLLCEHGSLLFDVKVDLPNLESPMGFVYLTAEEWTYIEKLYPRHIACGNGSRNHNRNGDRGSSSSGGGGDFDGGGGSGNDERCGDDIGGGDGGGSASKSMVDGAQPLCQSILVQQTEDGIVTTPPCCTSCREAGLRSRRSAELDYINGYVWIRKVEGKVGTNSSGEIVVTLAEGTEKRLPADAAAASKPPSSTSRRASSRSRVGKGCLKFTISSTTTVERLRVDVMQAFNVMPRDQHLFFRNVELDKNDSTLRSYEIPEKSELLLTVDPEIGFGDDEKFESGFVGTSLLSSSGGGGGGAATASGRNKEDCIVLDDDNDDDVAAVSSSNNTTTAATANRKRTTATASVDRGGGGNPIVIADSDDDDVGDDGDNDGGGSATEEAKLHVEVSKTKAKSGSQDNKAKRAKKEMAAAAAPSSGIATDPSRHVEVGDEIPDEQVADSSPDSTSMPHDPEGAAARPGVYQTSPGFKHMYPRAADGRYKCPHCDTDFASSSGVSRHTEKSCPTLFPVNAKRTPVNRVRSGQRRMIITDADDSDHQITCESMAIAMKRLSTTSYKQFYKCIREGVPLRNQWYIAYADDIYGDNGSRKSRFAKTADGKFECPHCKVGFAGEENVGTHIREKQCPGKKPPAKKRKRRGSTASDAGGSGGGGSGGGGGGGGGARASGTYDDAAIAAALAVGDGHAALQLGFTDESSSSVAKRKPRRSLGNPSKKERKQSEDDESFPTCYCNNGCLLLRDCPKSQSGGAGCASCGAFLFGIDVVNGKQVCGGCADNYTQTGFVVCTTCLFMPSLSSSSSSSSRRSSLQKESKASFSFNRMAAVDDAEEQSHPCPRESCFGTAPSHRHFHSLYVPLFNLLSTISPIHVWSTRGHLVELPRTWPNGIRSTQCQCHLV